MSSNILDQQWSTLKKCALIFSKVNNEGPNRNQEGPNLLMQKLNLPFGVRFGVSEEGLGITGFDF